MLPLVVRLVLPSNLGQGPPRLHGLELGFIGRLLIFVALISTLRRRVAHDDDVTIPNQLKVALAPDLHAPRLGLAVFTGVGEVELARRRVALA